MKNAKWMNIAGFYLSKGENILNKNKDIQRLEKH